MHLARVIGDVVATVKDPSLQGQKLLVLQPLTPARQVAGRPLVAVDSVGAGVGEEVFFVRGREASLPFLPRLVPTDANVVGIVDHWTTTGPPLRRSFGRTDAQPRRFAGTTASEA